MHAVKSSDTIYSVKAKVFDHTGLPPEQQWLYFAGTLLADSRTLADYNIGPEKCTLYMDLHLPWPRNRTHIQVNTSSRFGCKTIISAKVCCSATINSIKERIHDETSIPPDRQHLTLDGNLLKNGQALGDYNSGGSCVLALQLGLPGGK
ncbi:hypothetical protein ACQ4PT_004591 [Festuca glaucescens]